MPTRKAPSDSALTSEAAKPHDATFLLDKDATHITFMLARSQAIEAYADVEQILSTLCAHLMGVTVDIAGVFFFRMNNARQRVAGLERLLKKKHGDTYNLFWNSLVKELRTLDEHRNEVVHWIVEKTATSNNERWSCLVPPNYWDKRPNTPKLFLDDLYNFTMKANFFYHLVQHFNWVISGSKKKIHPSWPEICRQPIVYPPPDTHPLYRKWP